MNGTSGRKIDEDSTRSDVREQEQGKDKRKDDDKEVMMDWRERGGQNPRWVGGHEYGIRRKSSLCWAMCLFSTFLRIRGR